MSCVFHTSDVGATCRICVGVGSFGSASVCDCAAESDGVKKHVFVRRAQEALSVARVRGNGYVWKQGLQAMAYGGGSCFQTGLDRPTEEVG